MICPKSKITFGEIEQTSAKDIAFCRKTSIIPIRILQFCNHLPRCSGVVTVAELQAVRRSGFVLERMNGALKTEFNTEFNIDKNATTADVPRLSGFRRLLDGLYRYEYMLGMQTARRWHRRGRKLRCFLTPAARSVRYFWRRRVVLPLHRQHRKLHEMCSRFPQARRELRQAGKEGIRAWFACLGGLFRRAGSHYREELLSLWRLVGPAAAALVLIVTISVWANTHFCLTLTYGDQSLGYIENTGTYDSAAALAKERVVNVDNSFSVETAPRLAVTIQKGQNVMDDNQLCDAILSTYGDAIAEASGMYVDGSFVGAMESSDELQAMLEGMKDGFYDKNDENQRAEFVQDVQTVDGLYPAAVVLSADQLMGKLTSESVVKKTYQVQAGDTLSAIAVKNDMTTSELRQMNPAYASTDMVHIGDVLTVQQPQTYLQVKVIKRIYYTEKIAHTTQYVNNTNKPVTWSTVKTKGQDGSQNVTAEITYVNGTEQGRQVIATEVTKQPVTKVVERGTQKVVSSGGVTVVQGDGVTVGTMLWPVPICHNMSRGFGRGHSGLDICNGPVTVRNKPALAADGGTVIYAGRYYGYGNYVLIQHANGLQTAYGHLNSISVVKGQQVSRGQQIGLIGSTGQSSGPHLHFEVIRNGVKVNPLNYVRP